MSFLIDDILITMTASVAVASMLTVIKTLLDRKRATREEQEVKVEVERVVERYKDEPKDVLTLMRRNVAELREYYTINKQQARNAFSAALFVCFLGFLIFGGGVVLSYISPSTTGVVQYSTISGAIVETIAGLFFWLYSKSLKQINIFHESLQHTQKFLTAIQLTDEISGPNRDSAYAYIIQNVIGCSIPMNLVDGKSVSNRES